ncbi:MAG: hypothetical protein KFW07_00570 [Mycoplasmataceae bacterium]|nr:hypothetical protein [Mycoplasmataceae bacterium]
MNKKILITGAISTSLVAIGGIGGWALVSQNVVPIEERLINSKKIIPNLDEKMYGYSSIWVAKFSTDEDFVFSNVEGYNSYFDYKVVEKKAVSRNLELKIVISSKVENISITYDVILPNQFSETVPSNELIVSETIIDLPIFQRNIDLLTPPTTGVTIKPSDIEINSNKFVSDIGGAFYYKVNGSIVKAVRTLDAVSFKDDITENNAIWKEFEAENTRINGTKLDFASIYNSIMIYGRTLILFEVSYSEDSVTNTRGHVMGKNFSDQDPSNLVTNAKEINLSLDFSSSLETPTASDIIESMNVNNPTKYLSFDLIGDDAKWFENFNYKIKSVSLPENDMIKQTSLNVDIEISSKLSTNSKLYSKKIEGLQSFQQRELNDLKESSIDWMLNPIISPAYVGQTPQVIMESKNLEAFMFKQSELDKYPNYYFEIDSPILAGNNTTKYINIRVQIISNLNKDAKLEYFANIYDGFNPK